jgi:hypothetical protein
MTGRIPILRLSALLCLFLWSSFPVSAQKLDSNNNAANLEDKRCVEENYRHKTDAELRQMSAEQLADEDTKEWIYHVKLMDKYGMFTINSYTEKIGVEIIPVLTKVAKGFASRPLSECQQERFFTVLAIASDVDQQVVRLRSLKEGREAIAAAADAIKKMQDTGLSDDTTHPYNKSHFGEYLLDSARSTNQFDDDIRALLNSEFHVTLSDNDFVKFINFLTLKYPTYPSWTPRIEMARDLRTNKKKYYDAYLEFQRTAIN